jgi:hypothetical protein
LTCGWERSAPSILDRAADAAVDRRWTVLVDLVHWSTMDRPRGYALI